MGPNGPSEFHISRVEVASNFALCEIVRDNWALKALKSAFCALFCAILHAGAARSDGSRMPALSDRSAAMEVECLP
jgi:hypothetical protein